jgi:chemotaxis protein MotB
VKEESMPRKKKKDEEEHENGERWLVSYADLVTLLFAFFVTMYASSRVDGKKMGSAVESLQRALGSVIPVQATSREPGVFPSNNQPIRLSVTPIEGKPYTADGKALEKIAKELKTEIETVSKTKTNKEDVTGQIKFIVEKRGLVIRISEHVFFNSGEASIRSEMLTVLNIIAQSLKRIDNPIRIEGHTDNIPINTIRYPSNWELSTARATTIVRYLLDEFEYSPDQLSASGYAEFRPVAPNGTPEGRLQNRRVDFVVLSNTGMESEPQKGEAAEQNGPA